MGASGRTYFILEHKTSSKYHQAGESQKIIVDQVELGRDASCQVRFDESFETVSRKHAAIVRDGENWKLIHLSHSNPTLVNGHPINGSYYLQTGDEIQLSVGGPRLGFIVPQGRQALTSSITAKPQSLRQAPVHCDSISKLPVITSRCKSTCDQQNAGDGNPQGSPLGRFAWPCGFSSPAFNSLPAERDDDIPGSRGA